MLNQHLFVSREVREALAQGKPVVALESTIISHGMPYPQNLETARGCEQVAREHGAVPATCAILGGKLCVGLEEDQLDYLARTGTKVIKASRRDIPLLVAKKLDGATTVTGTMILAAMAGVRIHATGGIGGVHRGAQETMDISADLEELGKTPVAVVCAGAKSILDLPLTMEYLETRGVPVIGYQTDELPAPLVGAGTGAVAGQRHGPVPRTNHAGALHHHKAYTKSHGSVRYNRRRAGMDDQRKSFRP